MSIGPAVAGGPDRVVMPWGASHRRTPTRRRGATGKGKTPCQALRTRRPARPTGRLRWDDPPLIDHPALTFVSFSFTARQSSRSGGRFRLPAHPPRLPGAAEPTWLARQPWSPTDDSPTCRRRRPSCLVLARRPPPRSLAGCPAPDPERPPPCRSPVARLPTRRLGGSCPAPTLLPPREPGWFPSLVVIPSMVAHLRCPHLSEAVPRAPVGVRLPVRRPLCTLCFSWSSAIFQVTGLSTEKPRHPQIFFRRPPRVHNVVHM
jgi:hypothetical protein